MSEIQLTLEKADTLRNICREHANDPGELINILHKTHNF